MPTSSLPSIRALSSAKISDMFFSGLIDDGYISNEEKARWWEMPMEERKSPVARRIYLLGLVKTVAIGDLGALLTCFEAIRLLRCCELPPPFQPWLEANRVPAQTVYRAHAGLSMACNLMTACTIWVHPVDFIFPNPSLPPMAVSATSQNSTTWTRLPLN
ncbi:hypothetical protein IAR50_004293 [Cryptococcus sp. DSM 104548]